MVPILGIVNVHGLWCNHGNARSELSANGYCSLDWLHLFCMRFDLITIFPEFFAGPLDHGIVRRARENGLVEIHVQDLRAFTKDRHRTVDDRPFGGGEGMVLKPAPLFEAVESLIGHSAGDPLKRDEADAKTAIVLMSAAGGNCFARKRHGVTRSCSESFLFVGDMKALTSAWRSIWRQTKYPSVIS